ncbi:MAG: hypothetical protein QOF05_1710 [Sphingomonadales bacterium]|jgi:hypothetical protein|nr:hypothetical protein [Sphingomonadales bacterium]
MHKIALATAALCAVAPSAVIAAPITGAGSLAGANSINLPASNTVGAGPVVIGGGVTWSSNEANSLYGWTGGYVAGNNTILPGNPPIIALNNAYDVASGGYATMTLTFAAPTSGFLAELFWTDNEFTNFNSASIYIYDSGMNLLEFTGLNNNGNSIGLPSGYYGFSRASADISYVRFSNSHIGARNLSYVGPEINGVNAVPEPATWAMMLFGLAGIGLASRRRKTGRVDLA